MYTTTPDIATYNQMGKVIFANFLCPLKFPAIAFT